MSLRPSISAATTPAGSTASSRIPTGTPSSGAGAGKQGMHGIVAQSAAARAALESEREKREWERGGDESREKRERELVRWGAAGGDGTDTPRGGRGGDGRGEERGEGGERGGWVSSDRGGGGGGGGSGDGGSQSGVEPGQRRYSFSNDDDIVNMKTQGTYTLLMARCKGMAA